MTELDTKLPPKAAALIAKVAISGTLTQVAHSYTNAGGSGGGPSTPYAVSVTPPQGIGAELLPGSSLEATDLVTYMAGQGAPTVPAPKDVLAVNSREYVLHRVDELTTGDLVAAYRLYLRGKV